MSDPDQTDCFVVAGCKPWNRQVFDDVISKESGQWHFMATRDELTLERMRALSPRLVFFLHWSWLVPEEIVDQWECVCFHMTDLPYGRGGSPLQNLIVRGHRETKLTALRMEPGLDAGPVYLKERLSLEGGSEEVYIRATYLAAQMIGRIIDEQPVPVAQTGKAVTFARRESGESEIPGLPSLQALHDFIRMLDADGYPRAYLEHEGFRYEFSRAALYHGRIVADVAIRPLEETDQ